MPSDATSRVPPVSAKPPPARDRRRATDQESAAAIAREPQGIASVHPAATTATPVAPPGELGLDDVEVVDEVEQIDDDDAPLPQQRIELVQNFPQSDRIDRRGIQWWRHD